MLIVPGTETTQPFGIIETVTVSRRKADGRPHQALAVLAADAPALVRVPRGNPQLAGTTPALGPAGTITGGNIGGMGFLRS